MPLTDKAVQSAKALPKAYKMTDGDGMHLLVTPSGGKLWNFKFRFAGKEKKLSLGTYPEVSLAEARERRMAARKMLANGTDPSAAKQETKRQLRNTEAMASTLTFEAIARRWHAHSLSGWTERHATYIMRRLENDVFPDMGHRPLNEISPQEFMQVLKRVEARGANELARRLKYTCGQVFRFAIIHCSTSDYPITNNPAALMLSKDIFKPQQKTHFKALPEAEIPNLLRKLEHNEARL